jgi:hypothetical protein
MSIAARGPSARSSSLATITPTVSAPTKPPMLGVT